MHLGTVRAYRWRDSPRTEAECSPVGQDQPPWRFCPFFIRVPKTRYVYAGNHRIALIDSANHVYYYLNDHLGSAAVVIDSSGNVKDKYRYAAFGGSDGTTILR